MEPRGILRNRGETTPHDHNEGDLDRQEVIRNTRLNAQLSNDSSRGDKIRAKIAVAKLHEENGETHPEHLKWDEINLYKTEQEKAATMKIDEPKTPYEGGFNPEGEYYRDDGDDATSEIPDFSLGEGQFDNDEKVEESLNGGRVLPAEEPEEKDETEEEEEKPLLAEERHKKFEEMRKAHYHHAATPLKHKIDVSDDEE